MSHDYHSYPVAKRMKRWSPTEHFPTDLEPFELSDEILDSFFTEESQKNCSILVAQEFQALKNLQD